MYAAGMNVEAEAFQSVGVLAAVAAACSKPAGGVQEGARSTSQKSAENINNNKPNQKYKYYTL